MIKKDFLIAFIERLNSYQIIRTQSFLTIYDDWFIEVTKDLENEIYENTLLPSTDKTAYLEYIKKQVLDEVAYHGDTQFLNTWIEKHELDGLNFPFIENEEVQQLLATHVNHPGLNYTKKKLCTNMQMDFYCHAAMIEKYKMIAFIDKLLSQKNENNKVPDDEKKDKEYKNTIWFKVGELFASGEMEKYYSINHNNETIIKGEYNALKIAKELGNESFNKYILAIINNYGVEKSNGNKNIFNSRDKMLKIISHCKEKSFDVIPYFTERLPSE